jgi:hypothetical protein
MGTLTIRLPDEKHEKLRQLAALRKISINKLIEELSTIALTDFDAEAPFSCPRRPRLAPRGTPAAGPPRP